MFSCPGSCNHIGQQRETPNFRPFRRNPSRTARLSLSQNSGGTSYTSPQLFENNAALAQPAQPQPKERGQPCTLVQGYPRSWKIFAAREGEGESKHERQTTRTTLKRLSREF